MIVLELVLVVALILVNGFFAMSELAVVSSRAARLKAIAAAGEHGASAALALKEAPGRFLSTVQIGITMAGMFAGAFSGATFAEHLAGSLQAQGVNAALSETIALAAVVATISYLSLIFGELVPKQIALRNAERIAARVAPTMAWLSRRAAPAVWVLETSVGASLRLLGLRASSGQTVSQEEIKVMIAEAESAGIVEPAEKTMLNRVMRLSERPIAAVMTRRADIDWIDLDAAPAAIRTVVRQTRHGLLPAAHGTIDAVAGILHTKDLLDALLDGRTPDVAAMVRPAPALLETMDVLDAVTALKGAGAHLALVVDEYGLCEGIVTTTDILNAITGSFGAGGEPAEPPAVRRDDGSWLLDGALLVEDAAEILGVSLPAERDYHTVAGLMLSHLKHVPSAGQWFIGHGWRFEVVDMDGRRIDKVLATRWPLP